MTKFTTLMTIIIFFTMMTIIYMIILNNVHPIFLIILMMLYTLMVCLIMSMWSRNYMYSIMTFLIIISGLLIIFIYFASLISNEQNKISWYPSLSVSALLNFIFTILILTKYKFSFLMLPLFYTSKETLPILELNNGLFDNITKIFLPPNNNLTLMVMFYLLLALFMVIKICSLKSSSLRKIS